MNSSRGSAVARLLGDLKVRSLLIQALTLVAVIAVLWFLISTAAENLIRQGIARGFGFLWTETGWDVGESLVSHSAADPYIDTFLVGVLNTLYLSAVGIALTTVIGTLVGIGRVSRNWLIGKLALVYVEVIRSVPLLVQIIFWYTMMRFLPHPRAALAPVEGIKLTNRGIYLAAPEAHGSYPWVALALLFGLAAAIALGRWDARQGHPVSRRTPILLAYVFLALGPPLAVWLASGAPFNLEIPVRQGFNLVGGVAFSPEFLAILAGLSIYVSAFVAEIVRSGIESVNRGQIEAAQSIGLREGTILRSIIMPQALRVIVPPLTNWYLNLMKNSSLGVAVGYPELFRIGTITVNQTGQAVEVIVLMMLIYGLVSLLIAAAMNIYNRTVALRG